MLKAPETLPASNAAFIEPMECLATAKLPDGPQWVWEIKLDGYQALGVKNAGGGTLFSRRKKSLNRKFPYIVEALACKAGLSGFESHRYLHATLPSFVKRLEHLLPRFAL
jgi:bifunctional non-homologous end joining protein LigD